MKRKICVVSGSRAEYGLLRWLLQAIKADPALELQLVATGCHLAPEFGLTWRAMEGDGFVIARKVETLLASDTPVGIAKSLGLGVIGFADAFAELAPDLLLVLGDRFEILAAVCAAMVARIPVAHLHGGESTQGAIDEAIRHSITKMSHFHFVASDGCRRRVIQLGESPERVLTVGALGLDNLVRLKLLSRAELEAALGLRLLARNLLVTFHPATLQPGSAKEQLGELLAALHALDDTGLIFTLPNADTEGRELAHMLEEFVAGHPDAHLYPCLGSLHYLSCMRAVDGVVGNSSSGLIEAPAMGRGTINIGRRQEGREKAASVIDCEPRREEIGRALDQLYSAAFQARLEGVHNPYGEPGASARIAASLPQLALAGVLKKTFFDLDFKLSPSVHW